MNNNLQKYQAAVFADAAEGEKLGLSLPADADL